jgi:hypothetical protein
MDDATDRTACDLVIEACALLERGSQAELADAALAVEAARLRAELDAEVCRVTDPELADDLAGLAAGLDALLRRLDRLPAEAAALTG